MSSSRLSDGSLSVEMMSVSLLSLIITFVPIGVSQRTQRPIAPA